MSRPVEAATTDKTNLGFWIYLMTDCMLFASLFATYAVLRNNTNGGLPGSELFSLPFVLVETMLLLTSSFTCGLSLVAARMGAKKHLLALLGLTFALGAGFLGMEMYEFAKLAHEGNSWQQSGFLSAFFTLVGTHGLHITAGLIWLVTLMMIVAKQGISASTSRRLGLFGMFWHFLDIIWILIFTFVYLLGAV